MSNATYEMCAQPGCWHFIDENDAAAGWPSELGPVAAFLHLDDGEKEHDHDALPGGESMTLDDWQTRYPELFATYSDGKIGPNSERFIAPGGPRHG